MTNTSKQSASRPLSRVELERLAEKVYRLMQQDLRLEQARTGRTGRGGRR